MTVEINDQRGTTFHDLHVRDFKQSSFTEITA